MFTSGRIGATTMADPLDETISFDEPPARIPDAVRFVLPHDAGEPVRYVVDDVKGRAPVPPQAKWNYAEGRFVLASTMAGPHEFRPLGFFDRWRKMGRCHHCVEPRGAHPTEGYLPSRALGDRRSTVRIRAAIISR